MGIRVVLADDHRILLEGLRALLEGHADIEVVGEAADGRTAVRLADELSPDVVVMDLSMPDMNGFEATRRITAASPRTKVLALTAHSTPAAASQILEMGAAGYLRKEAAFDQLAKAICALMNESAPESPQRRGAADAGTAKGKSVFELLTPREREVLQLVAEGLAIKEIAAHLRLSIKTVETHRRAIMDKLGLYSVAQLTKYAVSEGITTVEAGLRL